MYIAEKHTIMVLMSPQFSTKQDTISIERSQEVSNILAIDSSISLNALIPIRAEEGDSERVKKPLKLFNLKGRRPKRLTSSLTICSRSILQSPKRFLSKNKYSKYIEV